MEIEIVDLPTRNGDFNRYVNVYQRVGLSITKYH